MPVERSCEVCGKTFYVVPSVVKRGWGLTCSVECRGQARAKMPTELVCEVCGSPYKIKLSHAKNSHTCSNKCRHKRHSRIILGHPFNGGAAPKGHPAWGGYETRFKKGQKPWNTGLNISGMSGKKVSEETKRKIAKANNKPEYIKKRQKALHKRPTKPEKTVIDLIAKNNLPFKYTGDGEAVVGSFIPDFIHSKGENKLIEVFGRVFHDPRVSHLDVSWNRQYWGRKAIYSQLGYDCLILWDDELNSETRVLDKIGSFLGKGGFK